jgi:hypothetical protein
MLKSMDVVGNAPNQQGMDVPVTRIHLEGAEETFQPTPYTIYRRYSNKRYDDKVRNFLAEYEM